MAAANEDEDHLVVFSNTFSDSGLKLVEIPPEIDFDSLATSKSLCFKASGNDHAVLCTASKTFAVKMVDISNTMYLTMPIAAGEGAGGGGAMQISDLDDDESKIEVQASVSGYIELTECPPNKGQLTALLAKSRYTGPAGEAKITATDKFAWQDLVSSVQASPAELDAALMQVDAFEVDGHWRQLDEEYAASVFGDVLNCAVADDMPLDQICVSKLTESLKGQEVPQFVVECLVKRFGSAVEGTGEGGGEVLYALDHQSVCQHEAIELFKIQERWPFEPFMETWQERLPDTMKTDLKYLDTISIVSDAGTVGGDKELCFFPAWTLSMDTKKRVAELFKKQAIWSIEAISPYLRAVATEKVTVEKILFKHARAFRDPDGKRCYNKR